MKLKKKKKLLDILEAARALIAQGWCQGPLAVDNIDHPVGVRSPRACKWCASGAVLASTLGDYYDQSSTMRYLDKIVKKMSRLDSPEVHTYSSGIVQLNEAPDTSRDTVMEVFDVAIARLKRKINDHYHKKGNA